MSRIRPFPFRRPLAPALGVLLLVAACGFEPLYAPRGGVPQAMHSVQIANIPDRSGQILRNHLRNEMNPRGTPGNPAYRLDVSLLERREDLGLRRDDVRTRTNLIVSADFRLVSMADGKTVLAGSTRTISGFDILVNDYATIVSERDAREQALIEIGNDIRTRVALYFKRTDAGG
ncbi:MAG: LPS assembly lipoprotein LptE [Alphaproteobacteria bacterium]